MLKSSTCIALLGLSTLLTFTSCDEDPVTRTDSDVALSFEYLANGEDFAYEQVYDINGVATQFYAVQFYLGGLTFMPANGDAVAVEDYLLVKPGMTSETLVALEKGDYDRLNFFVGVAPDDNDQTEDDFTSRTADDPLAKQPADQPQMHWNWNSGYIFFRIDGQVDTDGDGTPDSPLEMHIGTNNFLRDISIDLNQEITSDQTTLALSMEISQLFNGIDLANDHLCHTGDAPDIAAAFANNLADAFGMK